MICINNSSRMMGAIRDEDLPADFHTAQQHSLHRTPIKRGAGENER
jgi:hypothetical protein